MQPLIQPPVPTRPRVVTLRNPRRFRVDVERRIRAVRQTNQNRGQRVVSMPVAVVRLVLRNLADFLNLDRRYRAPHYIGDSLLLIAGFLSSRTCSPASIG